MSWEIFFIALLLPIAGSLLGFLIPPKISSWISFLGVVLSFILSLILVFDNIDPFRFFWLGNLQLGWQLDNLSKYLVLLVFLISTFVHLFSVGYMRNDPRKRLYFLLLGGFTSAMAGLLAADHLLLLFIFWELVGFTSYLLIGFWFEDEKNAFGARIAFITNRIADAPFLAGIVVLMTVYDIQFLSEITTTEISGLIGSVALFGIAIGCFGKSAQFPFWNWLPRAMAGPTPVSALIHAATMVTAGVYLLTRLSPIFSAIVLDVVLYVSLFTSVVAAASALFQNDLKRILAYSTISQLGLMIAAIGIGSPESGIFHLWTHAFFKAGLFLTAASILGVFQTVDGGIIKMGGLLKRQPLLSWLFILFNASLIGIPLTSGFFSKEGILAAFYSGSDSSTSTIFIILVIILTAAYSSRMVFHVCIKPFDGVQRSFDMPRSFKYSLFGLGLGSLGLVYAINPFGHEFWILDELFLTPNFASGSLIVTIISLGAILLGCGFYLWIKSFPNFNFEKSGLQIMTDGLGFDHFYTVHLSTYFMNTAIYIAEIDQRIISPFLRRIAVGFIVLAKIADLVDKLFVDGIVNLAASISSFGGRAINLFQSGRIQLQLIWMSVGVLIITLIVISLG